MEAAKKAAGTKVEDTTADLNDILKRFILACQKTENQSVKIR